MKKIKKEKLSFDKLTVSTLSNKNMLIVKGGDTDRPDDPDTTTDYGGGYSTVDC